MRIPSWLWRSPKKQPERDRKELEQARREVSELGRRSEKLLRENHFVRDVKKVLGAQ